MGSQDEQSRQITDRDTSVLMTHEASIMRHSKFSEEEPSPMA
jgi:hypothetical protein